MKNRMIGLSRFARYGRIVSICGVLTLFFYGVSLMGKIKHETNYDFATNENTLTKKIERAFEQTNNESNALWPTVPKSTPATNTPATATNSTRKLTYEEIIASKMSSIATSLKHGPMFNRKGKIVLIMAYYRSGSSFFGELFNRNPDVFYLFEPLLPFGPNCDQLYQERLEVLYNISVCDFRSIRRAYLMAHEVTKHNDKPIGCLRTNVCFPTNHRLFLDRYHRLKELTRKNFSQPLSDINMFKLAEAEKSTPHEQPPMNGVYFSDQPYNTTLESAMCHTSGVVAYKLLRIWNLHKLEEVYKNLTAQGSDVYVIHLVRDPRAMLNSGLNLELKKTNALSHSRRMCDKVKANVQFVQNRSIASKIKDDNRIMQIRFEDVATDPFGSVQKIYKFIGEEVHEDVNTWLSENVSPLLTLKKIKYKLANQKMVYSERLTLLKKTKALQAQLANPYGTARNTTAVLNKWRIKLNFTDVQKYQTECRELMKVLNYTEVENSSQQSNLSLTLW